MTSTELIESINNFVDTTARNSMGCTENGYFYPWCMKQLFSNEEITQMTQRELDLLEKLHEFMAEVFY